MEATNKNDNQLMTAVSHGQVEHLGVLFEKYKRVLFTFFYSNNHDVALSEDLVQNVFMRILKYRDRFRGDGQFKHWMFRIAKHVQADHYRKHKNRRSEDITIYNETLPTDVSLDRDMDNREAVAIMRRALQQIDPAKREAIVLSRLHGMKYRAIGEILGITESAVKVRVFRGMKELTTIYQKLSNQ